MDTKAQLPQTRRRAWLAGASPLVLVAALAALATSPPTADELTARKEYVASLDAARQQELLRRFERFSALPQEEQQRLRALQAAITADPNSERLLKVLERYHEWLKTISPTQRARLAELPAKQRVEEIEPHSPRPAARRARRAADLGRSAADPPLGRCPGRPASTAARRQHSRPVSQVVQRAKRPGRQANGAGLSALWCSRDGRDDTTVTPDDIERLSGKLSASAQAELTKAATPSEQMRTVRSWVFAALPRFSPAHRERRANPLVGEELLQFLQNEVSPADRERLLNMPREEMLHELRKMYFERALSEREGGPQRGHFDSRPDGPRGPRSRRRPNDGDDDKPARPKQPGPTDAKQPAPAS